MAILNTCIGPERVQVLCNPIGTVQVAGAGISTLGLVISTCFACCPVINTPTKVTDLAAFETKFGDVDDVNFRGWEAVKGFFDNAGTGSTIIVVNVGVCTCCSLTSTSFIGTVSACGNTGLRAFDSEDTLGLIAIPGLPLRLAYLVQTAVIDYADTTRADFGSTLSTTFALNSIPVQITTACCDCRVVTSTMHYVSQAASGCCFAITVGDSAGACAAAACGALVITNVANLLTCCTPDTITVNGQAFVAQAAAVTANTLFFQASGTVCATATSLAAQITNNTTAVVSATACAATVTVLADVKGTAANAFALTYTDPDCMVGATITCATLTGGVNGAATLSAVTAGMTIVCGSNTFVVTAACDTCDTVTVSTDPCACFSLGCAFPVSLPSAVNYKEKVVNNPSKLAAWYFNHVKVTDDKVAAAAGALANVDPVGHVAGVMARIDSNKSIGGHSHAPAGIKFAGIAGINSLQLALSERTDAAPLRLNFINRITSFPGAGNVIFGGYTAEAGSVAVFTACEQLIQVMRTLQFIKASLEPGLQAFIWENFSPETQAQIHNAIEGFLRNNIHLFPAGLAEASQFQVVDISPTQAELDKGLLRVRVLIKPNTAVRFIEISLEFPIPTT